MEKVRLGDIVDTIQGSQYPVDEQICCCVNDVKQNYIKIYSI